MQQLEKDGLSVENSSFFRGLTNVMEFSKLLVRVVRPNNIYRFSPAISSMMLYIFKCRVFYICEQLCDAAHGMERHESMLAKMEDLERNINKLEPDQYDYNENEVKIVRIVRSLFDMSNT